METKQTNKLWNVTNKFTGKTVRVMAASAKDATPKLLAGRFVVTPTLLASRFMK